MDEPYRVAARRPLIQLDVAVDDAQLDVLATL
jgi:hypothetical protein